MLKRFATLAALVCLPCIVQAQDDLKKLQGTWVLEALEVNGARVNVDRLQGTTATVKDDLYTVTLKDKAVFVMLLKLDEKKDPREIDMIAQDGAEKDKNHRGIYMFKDDTFVIVRCLMPDLPRPRDFATSANTGQFMATWKRKE